MLTLDKIRKMLDSRRIDKVAEATGLSYATVQQIRAGTQSNPTYTTVKILSDFLTGSDNG